MSTQQTQPKRTTNRENEYPDYRDDCPPVDPDEPVGEDIVRMSSIESIPTPDQMSQNDSVGTDLYDFVNDQEWIGILQRLDILSVGDSVDKLPPQNTVKYSGRFADFNQRLFGHKMQDIDEYEVSDGNIDKLFENDDVPIDELPLVTFSSDYLDDIVQEAAERNESYINGHGSYSDGGRVFGGSGESDSVRKHIVGLIGELTCSILFGTEYDSAVYSRGDDGFDMSFDGITVDIKTTETNVKRPNLLVPTGEITADMYIQMHVLDPVKNCKNVRVRFVGLASSDTVEKSDIESEKYETENHVVDLSDCNIGRELAISNGFTF